MKMKHWLGSLALLVLVFGSVSAQATDETALILERDATQIHYWVAGAEDAPLIVLTHGAGMDHRMFDPQIEPLVDAGYRVLTWDVRGHGLSKPLGDEFTMELAAADLLALLDELAVEQAILVGQSMGGYISQYAYLAQPERVRALAMIGSMSVTQPYSEFEMQALAASQSLLANFPYPALIQITAGRVAELPDVQEYVREAMAQLTHDEFNSIWAGVATAISADGVPNRPLEVPLLITHGANDTSGLIRAKAPAWVAAEPQVTYVVIPAAAHNANQDNAAFFNETLLAWLATVNEKD
jgi:pimeloyl-ACP methyl ester carboxylesterase